MNWTFWKIEPKETASNETEFVDGWRLTITMIGERGHIHYYEQPTYKHLSKMYFWFLTRDSEKYNMEFKDGMRIYHRQNIVDMAMTKIKLPKKDWVKQETNDEAKTD